MMDWSSERTSGSRWGVVREEEKRAFSSCAVSVSMVRYRESLTWMLKSQVGRGRRDRVGYKFSAFLRVE